MASQGQKGEETAPINDFNSHYQFLNNDHPAWVALDGLLFPSAAVAYQAARTDNPAVRQQLSEVETYEKFKEIAMGISNPSDWNGKKSSVMEKLVRDKFKRNKEIGNKLMATSPRPLVNTFKQGGENEQFWGVVAGKGFNNLGKILLKVREEMHRGLDWQLWVKDQGVEEDEKLWPIVSLVVIKEDKPVDKLFLEKRSKFFFGNQEANKEPKIIKLEHPSISKVHACVYFGFDLSIMLVDLGSSNGTSITRDGKTFKLEALRPIALEKGDFIIFGLSSRKYKVEVDLSKVEEHYLKCQKQRIEQEMRRAREKERNSERERERQRERVREKEDRRSRSRSRSPKHRKHRS